MRPATGQLYALGSSGKLYCLDLETGHEDYVFDVLADNQNKPPELFSSLTVAFVPDAKGVKRQIVFGAGVNNFITKAAVVYCYEDRWLGP